MPKRKNSKKFYNLTKSVLDIFFGILILIISLPLFLVIALLIKFSSRGPILFFQKRIGKNSRPFKCIKFRTMHPEAEDILRNLLNNNKLLRKEFKETHKMKNDPRITEIGRFLRKTSLDELPQLINVIKGEMSFVGPRPVVKDEIKKYGLNYKKVISVNPGITGLWQVSGRNKLSYEKRIALDLNYIKNYNFIMDLRILVRTFGVVLFPLDRGAY